MKIVKHITPPAGLTRLLLRLPILIYRAGLGWLFGRRMLLLNHVGRVSGRPRHTVLEVVDDDPAEDSFVVASAWGPGAQWYRNILHRPDVTIRVARRTIPVTALPLTDDDGAEIFARYASRHRRLAMQMLPRVLGVSVDGTEADFREVGRRMPFVRFVCRQ
jgi:deazaflavin-dependent oxidoreductase (nitroreductase family)